MATKWILTIPMISLFLAINLLILGASTAVAQGRSNDREISTLFAHEKDLAIDTKGIGVGHFKWSPDSRRIAYVEVNAGQIGIADVETGQVKTIPDFHLAAIHAIAWSNDGHLVAASNSYELRIVRLSDFQTIHVAYLKGEDAQTSLRFGRVMAFSRDDGQLIFENPADNAHVILGRYDLATRTIEPLARSPFGTRNAFLLPASGRFQWRNGHLYYSTLIRRLDETQKRINIVDQVDRGSMLIPSTYVVFDLGDGKSLVAVRSRDFPPQGEEKEDGSEDVSACGFSAPTNSLVVRRNN